MVYLTDDVLNDLRDEIFRVKGFNTSNEQVQKVWNALPDSIQTIGIQWGVNDTEFCDEFRKFLKRTNILI